MTLEFRQVETHGKGAFTASDGNRRAGEMTYSRPNPSFVIVDHTEVFPGFEGQGVGRQLVAKGVEWARQNAQKILPLCPFAKSVFERTPDYADVWYK